MNVEDAELYLVNSLPRTETTQNEAILRELLQELAYLPLAMAQAASYIAKASITISKYLELMRDTENTMVNLLSHEFRDRTREVNSQNAVAITWLVFFEKIMKEEPNAANFLFFLAFLENKAIPRSILPSVGSGGDLIYSLGILLGYSFLTESGDGEMYEMHRLVQHAVKIWMRRQDIVHVWGKRTISHLAAIFPNRSWENRNLWREYAPHAIRVLQNTSGINTSERAQLCLSLGLCLEVDGRIQESFAYVSECASWRNQALPEVNFDRQQAQYHLAAGYALNGQDDEAREILEKVVAIRNRILPERNPFRLQPLVLLATACRHDGQIQRSVELLESVFIAKGLESDVVDLTQFQVQQELAVAYLSNGQVDEALGLLEKLIAVHKRFQPEDNPLRLLTQYQLGLAYRSKKQFHVAIEVLDSVVNIESRILPPGHPDRLASQYGLAVACMDAKQTDRGITLMGQAVAAAQRTLSPTNPNRLAFQHGLAIAYMDARQTDRAIALMEEVVAADQRTLSPTHPDRISLKNI